MFNLIVGVASIGLGVATALAGLHVARPWARPSENPQVVALRAANEIGVAQGARIQGQPLPAGWSYGPDGHTAWRSIPFESCGVINAAIGAPYECPACDDSAVACVSEAGPVARAL